MKRRRSSLFSLFLLLILFFAGAVYWVSLSTPMMRNMPAVAQLIRRAVLVQPPEKLEWTEDDREVQKGLQDMLAAREPPQRLVVDRNRELDGRVIGERPDAIVFAAQIGDSGEVSMPVARGRIVRIEERDVQLPEVTLRDVRFYREFPGKKFYKRPPYTIMTDEPYFAVDLIVEQQQELYARFIELFSPLVEISRRNDIQLLVFSNADEFELYRLQANGVEKASGGFYNIRQDRLIVLRQRNAGWVKEGKKEIAGIVEEHRGRAQTARARQRLVQWEDDAQNRLSAQADGVTRSILRHEGAHQLAYTLGVQNKLEDGRGWISEGLATYFETGTPGGKNEARTAELESALKNGEWMSIHQLLSVPRCRSGLHYAQAWSLTCLLMQPEYRPAFFAYLAQIRSDSNLSFYSPEEELCYFLGFSPLELQRRWMAFIKPD